MTRLPGEGSSAPGLRLLALRFEGFTPNIEGQPGQNSIPPDSDATH